MVTVDQIEEEAERAGWAAKRLSPRSAVIVRTVEVQGVTLRLRKDWDWDAYETGHKWLGRMGSVKQLRLYVDTVAQNRAERLRVSQYRLNNALRDVKPQEVTPAVKAREAKVRAALAVVHSLRIADLAKMTGLNYSQIRYVLHRIGAERHTWDGDVLWKLPREVA